MRAISDESALAAARDVKTKLRELTEYSDFAKELDLDGTDLSTAAGRAKYLSKRLPKDFSVWATAKHKGINVERSDPHKRIKFNLND